LVTPLTKHVEDFCPLTIILFVMVTDSNHFENRNLNRMLTIITLLISGLALALGLLALSPIQVMFPQGTGSMEPLLDDGDEVVIVNTHVNADQVNTGDIIVFNSYCKSDTDLLIHKAISQGDAGIITSGISTDAIDQRYPCRPAVTDQTLTGRAMIVFEL